MKNLILIIFVLSAIATFSQTNTEKEVISKVNEAIVFLESAQITRKKTITIAKGITLLRFIKLSPFIDGKSVQVKTSNDVEIQAVNFGKNYLNKQTKNTDLVNLENDLKVFQKKLSLEKTLLTINEEETNFLISNKIIGGKNQTLTAVHLKNMATYFGTKYKSLKLDALKIKERINLTYAALDDVKNQIGSFSSKKEFASGEVFIKIKAAKTTTIKLELIYNVANAGWFPTYDIRVKDINTPLSLVYKANVKQQTKVDWNNIKLSFSSSDPSTSSEAPILKTYFLNYNSRPPVYAKNIKTVSGFITDMGGALPGVQVSVEGTTIGTETNFDGHYSISIPKNATTLSFSYLGYVTAKRNIYKANLNVQLQENLSSLDEVVIVGYGNRPTPSALEGTVSGVQIRSVSSIKSKPKYTIPTNQVVNQTTVNFEIAAPYSLKSSNKNYTVGMKTYELDVDYQYSSIPKIDKNVFLIAYASDWEKLNLLEGEASIYFEGTYIGKSLLDTRFVTDKLKISLGRDKNIVIQRTKTKNFTTKQFIGSKKVENRAWSISVKNNKSQKINISITDQIPISTLEEIKIELNETNTGKFNKETGKNLWKFELPANSSRNLQLKYSVKYPKDRNVVLD